MTATNKARTTAEMRFAASLRPCEACGTRELGTLELSGEGTRWRYDSTCPLCGAARTFEFETAGDPRTARHSRYELGELRSSVITPEQFLKEADALSKNVPADPSGMSPAQKRKTAGDLTRAITSISELLKQLPPDDDERLPGSTDPRMVRREIEKDYLRISKLISKYRPSPSLTYDMLDAHADWLRRGGQGAGRIALTGRKLADEWYGAVDLTMTTLTECDLTNADFNGAVFDQAAFERCICTNAGLSGASLTNATINRGKWDSAQLRLAKLNAATLDNTDFSKADLDRSWWRNAKVKDTKFEGATFSNSVLDGATFERCRFAGVTFKRAMAEPQPTSRGTRFIDCDFSGVDFSDRDLAATTFVRCQLGASTGAKDAAGLVLDSCDVDKAGFLGRTN